MHPSPPIWLERQRQRWMRPDAHRYVRPDASRYFGPSYEPKGRIESACPARDGDLERVRHEQLRLKSMLIDLTIDLLRRRLARKYNLNQRHALERLNAQLRNKGGFREDQPRWPKNSGEISGRWSGGAGTAVGHSGQSPIRGGHHFVVRSLYERLPLRPETAKVFQGAVTGPLNYGPHRGGRQHEIYNKAVGEHFERFMKDNGIRTEDMTPDQARKFVDEIKRSNDLRIRRFNLRIYVREIMYWLRRIPRGNE